MEYRLGHCSLSSLFISLLLKKVVIVAPVFLLVLSLHLRQMLCFPSGMCICTDKYVHSFVYMCVSQRENCLRKYVYAYLFNLAHMHMPLNLDAIHDMS